MMYTKRLKTRVLAVLTACALVAPLAACDSGIGGTDDAKPWKPSGHHPIETIDEPRGQAPGNVALLLVKPSPKLLTCSKGVLRGCTKDQMDEYASSAVQLTWNDFLAVQSSAKPPEQYMFVPSNPKYVGKAACSGLDFERVELNANAYMYCGGDGYVYTGQNQMWEFYGYGPLVPMLAVAHENIHVIQAQAGVQKAWTGIPSINELHDMPYAERLKVISPWLKLMELQADCGAGVWLREMQRQGKIGADTNTINQFTRFMADLDPKRKSYDHGSANERKAALLRGYNSKTGLKGCNDFHDDQGRSYKGRPIAP